MIGWAILLIILAVILYVLEVFLPSAGLLMILATLCLLGGVVMLFMVDATLGLIVAAVALVVGPALVMVWAKVFPHTRFGRRFTLAAEQNPHTVIYDPELAGVEQLVGASGVAVSDLRPIGTCKFDDRRLECFAETGMIEAGTRIRVVRVEGNNIKVRPA